MAAKPRRRAASAAQHKIKTGGLTDEDLETKYQDCGAMAYAVKCTRQEKNLRKVDDRDNIDSTYRMKDIRREVKAAQGNRCPICGEVSEQMELHHILPFARFPELWDDRRNCVALCHDCHKEIHCNPWANIRMMEAKAVELGLDLGERYDM